MGFDLHPTGRLLDAAIGNKWRCAASYLPIGTLDLGKSGSAAFTYWLSKLYLLRANWDPRGDVRASWYSVAVWYAVLCPVDLKCGSGRFNCRLLIRSRKFPISYKLRHVQPTVFVVCRLSTCVYIGQHQHEDPYT